MVEVKRVRCHVVAGRGRRRRGGSSMFVLSIAPLRGVFCLTECGAAVSLGSGESDAGLLMHDNSCRVFEQQDQEEGGRFLLCALFLIQSSGQEAPVTAAPFNFFFFYTGATIHEGRRGSLASLDSFLIGGKTVAFQWL